MIYIALYQYVGLAVCLFFTCVGAILYLVFAAECVGKWIRSTSETEEEYVNRKLNRRWQLSVDQLLSGERRRDSGPAPTSWRQWCCLQRRERLLTLQCDADGGGWSSSSEFPFSDLQASQVASAVQTSDPATGRSAAERGRHTATSSSDSSAAAGKHNTREKTVLQQQQQPTAASATIGVNGPALDHVRSRLGLPLTVKAKEASLLLSYAALAAAELETCGCDWRKNNETFHWLLSVEEDSCAPIGENIREGPQLVATVVDDTATSRTRQSLQQPSHRSRHYLIRLQMTTIVDGVASAAAETTDNTTGGETPLDDEAMSHTDVVDAEETDSEGNDGYSHMMAALEQFFSASSLGGGVETTQTETGRRAPVRPATDVTVAKEQTSLVRCRRSNAAHDNGFFCDASVSDSPGPRCG